MSAADVGLRNHADLVVVPVTIVGGHKLPTAFPSRRCWLHVAVRDRNDRVVFESGALRPDGSIVGNDNDADPRRFEPHYNEIANSEQVQIYEDIMGDPNGQVTTGILTGVRYLKDNRLLPRGFDKQSPDKDIAVIGEALSDPNFTSDGNRVRYSVNLGDVQGPVRVEAELWYQPIGYRWANNLKPYNAAAEPRRFTGFFDSMAQASAEVLARASESCICMPEENGRSCRTATRASRRLIKKARALSATWERVTCSSSRQTFRTRSRACQDAGLRCWKGGEEG